VVDIPQNLLYYRRSERIKAPEIKQEGGVIIVVAGAGSLNYSFLPLIL